ncbi:MAG: aspartate kinase [Candidatus Eremiobacteraeota bacterium]|nr:aspartate kinase [Candidatus Eremiobacteraeota bacterium]
MIVMKFGGSSLRDSVMVRSVAEIIRSSLPSCPVLVCSAMGSVTDWLIECGEDACRGRRYDLEKIEALHLHTAEQLGIPEAPVELLLSELKSLLKGISLIRELSLRTRDYLVSFGERLSVRIMAGYLDQEVHRARFFDAWDIGMLTSSEHQNAAVLDESYEAIALSLSPLAAHYEYIPVITGFIGKDRMGAITTLGRGGSDLTASAVGKAVAAEEVQVWKDVDGLMTTDPKIVPQAEVVGEISFEEASELAYFGAKILHPLSILPAMAKNIPVRVKNSYKPHLPGTVIKKSVAHEAMVRVITFQRNVTLIDIVSTRMLGLAGFLEKVFHSFACHGLSVDLIASSEVSISLTLNKNTSDPALVEKVMADLGEIATVAVSTGKSILTVVGDVERSTELLLGISTVLRSERIRVQVISQGASKVNVSFVIDDGELERAVRAVHAEFFCRIP